MKGRTVTGGKRRKQLMEERRGDWKECPRSFSFRKELNRSCSALSEIGDSDRKSAA